MSLAHAILGVLDARPMSGYELSQFLDASMAWVWTAPHSQVYPLLRKMSDRGWIEGERQIRGTKLERRLYSITEDGREELRRWTAQPLDAATKRDAVLLQALFFDMIEPGQAAAILADLIEEQQRLIEQWEAHAMELDSGTTPLLQERLKGRAPAEHARICALKAQVFRGQVALAEARIDWARKTIEILTATRTKSRRRST